VPILSGEALAISALLNNHDVTAGRSYGLRPEHFIGYQAEYNWLLNYYERYGTDPSKDAFKEAFPHFTFSEHEDVRSAVDMVFKAYAKRDITEAISNAYDLLQVGEIHEAWSTLAQAEPLRTNPKPRRVLTDLDFLDDWESGSSCIEVPYRSLQRLTGGIRPGQIWYLAARPKNGKSAHLVNFVKRAVMDGCRVKFYSLEMSEAEVRARFHAAYATYLVSKGRKEFKEITLTNIREKKVDRHTYKGFMGVLQDLLDDRGGHIDIHTPAEGLVTPGVIAASAGEYDLNVVDYIGLMRADGGSRAVDDWRVLASISNDLKLTAAQQKTAMLVASQINRDGETGSEPPRLANLAGSDALGQDGDVICTMRAKPHNVATAISVEGNRHGPSGKFYTKFDPDLGVFDEISRDEVEDLVNAAEPL